MVVDSKRLSKHLPRTNAPLSSRLRIRFDVYLALAVLSLLVAGMLNVYSATTDMGFRYKDDPLYYFRTQSYALALGLVALVIVLQFDYAALKKFSVPVMVVTLAFMVVVLIAGEATNGSIRGLSGGSYSPSEVAKLATIMYIAHWLASKGDRIKNIWYGLVPFSVMIGLVCFLVMMQPDLSTSVLLAIIAFSMFFVAGADWRQFGVAILMAVAVFGLLMLMLPHAAERFQSWIALLKDPSTAVWQVQLAMISLGTGGVMGTGIGRGPNKYVLPVAHSDGAFAVWGEEMGLIGGLLIIIAFAIIVWRGFVIARNARSSYGFLLAIGVTCWLGFQALINLAVITASMPVTGMPLPFISYGGTSLAVTLAGVGVLLSVSRDMGVGETLKPSKSVLGSIRENSNLRWRNRRTHLSGAGRRGTAQSKRRSD
jgi:cell division protein FtsW